MTSEHRDDFERLQRWRGGDRAAGDELFAAHFASVYGFFRNKVDEAAAEELTQSTFLALVDGKDKFREQSTFRTYMFAVARNHLYMHFRKRGTHDRVIEFNTVSVADLGASPGSIAAAQQEQVLLLRALRLLPVDFQIAIELYYWEDLTTGELAQVLDIAEGTVRSRLTRARERLAKIIEELAVSPHTARSTVHGFEDWAKSLRALVGRRAG